MQSLESLKRLIANSSTLAVEELATNYPVIRIDRSEASAAVALHGAHLLSWQPAGSQPVIYTSPAAIYAEGKAIRGGIPICWPWFGPHPNDPSKPSHGFARNRFWRLTQVLEESGATTLQFTLACQGADCREFYPHQVSLACRMRIGASLTVSLETSNLDDQPIRVGGALHTYFAVGDLAETAVTGLEDCAYLDCVGERTVREQAGAIHFGGEVDRIYRAAPPVRIVDRAWNRAITITPRGSRSTVVWNPGFEKAAALGDLPAHAYRDFVCVETANAGPDVRIVPPGERTTLTATISC